MKPSTAVALAAEARCELTTINGGRCAQSCRYEVHHIKYRSSGGSDEGDNLAPVCPHHHAAIHRTEKPFLNGPYKDRRTGRRYYTEDVGDVENVEKIRWWLWRDVADDFTEKEQRIHGALMKAREQMDTTRYGAAVLVAEIDALALYSLRGYDSGIDYIVGELGESVSSARHALNVGEYLRVNPHLLTTVQEGGLHFTTLRESLGSLKRIAGDKQKAIVQNMIEAQAAGVPGEAITASVREAAGNPSRNEWEVSAKIEATGKRVTLNVDAASEQAAWNRFERLAGLLGPLGDVLRIVDKKARKL
jgi:hypothetical protein